MTKHQFFFTYALAALLAAGTSLADAQMIRIPTNLGDGADAEIREFQPNRKDGFGTELATRIRDAVPGFLEPPTQPGGPTTDRSSMFYVRIDTSQLTPSQVANSTNVLLQLTYRNTNINQGRVKQTVHYDIDGNKTTDMSLAVESTTKRAGLNFWALNIGHSGNDWIEDPNHPDGIHYNNAPGILPDLNIGTIDIDPSQAVFLGRKDIPERGPTQNHLPVGGQFNFSSSDLTQYVNDAKAVGQDLMTFMVAIAFDVVSTPGAPPTFDGDIDFNQITNFNYLFNSKEMLTLNNDPNYNPDNVVYGPFPLLPVPGSPWSQADNSNGRFSPALVFLGIPEPSSMVLFGIGIAGVSLVRRRK